MARVAWAAASAALFRTTAPWFDVFAAYARLASDRPFDDIEQSLTAIGVWVVLPCVLGLVRSPRREVK
ncbi:MAG: hypothetical protein AVDCRST_MAG50-2893 [uncultured Acidimicrobiales bacterium]|uniref:Uncharacterized protein n=1 Tax=uncultured Acidimicrobiales bacterium TaxID=310071 RepID=A0A6J4ITF0_9ACTN|nr:MAG: hypothetical protein AVDCRST_MAG50-2893 [uncultured Acidimicrobiales bacterium]